MVFRNIKKWPVWSLLKLSSFQILAMFRRGLFYTYLSIYLREFLGLSVTETTLYATLPMIMNVLFQTFVWGPLSDKFQRRRTLIIGGEILAGLGTILVWLIHFGFSNLYLAGYIIIIGLSCIEIFWSSSNVGWSALISDLYAPKRRSAIMGVLTSLGGGGRFIGILIGGLLYEEGLGFRLGWLFFIASAIMFVSTIPIYFMPEGGIKLEQEEEKIDVKNVEKRNNNNRNVTIFIVFIIALALINFGRNSISVIYSQFLSLDSGFNVDSILLSFIVNTRSIAIILIGFTAGYLSKKIGHEITLILGTFSAIVAILITALTPNLPFMFVGSFLIGMGDVIITAASYALASILIPPKRRGKLFAVYNMTFFLSWGLACTLITAPLIDILILNGFGDLFAYRIAFITAAIICGIGLVIFLILEIWRRSKKFN
ncbi:MAG: MFS transporter [Promethearchaeota archaeon]|nr:MAG: MFS transporter [Candidatus Lokiarchaeota archaeon]